MCIFDVLKDKALIRELHVYGDTNAVENCANPTEGCEYKVFVFELENPENTVTFY